MLFNQTQNAQNIVKPSLFHFKLAVIVSTKTRLEKYVFANLERKKERLIFSDKSYVSKETHGSTTASNPIKVFTKWRVGRESSDKDWGSLKCGYAAGNKLTPTSNFHNNFIRGTQIL